MCTSIDTLFDVKVVLFSHVLMLFLWVIPKAKYISNYQPKKEDFSESTVCSDRNANGLVLTMLGMHWFETTSFVKLYRTDNRNCLDPRLWKKKSSIIWSNNIIPIYLFLFKLKYQSCMDELIPDLWLFLFMYSQVL